MGAESISIDTLRNVFCSENVSVDTGRHVICSETVSVDTARKRTSSLFGCTTLSIILAAKSLTDKFALTTYQPVILEQLLIGHVRSFNFALKVKELLITDGLYSVTGVYDIDHLLSKPLAYDASLKKATSTVYAIAAVLGSAVNISIDDFAVDNQSGGRPTCKEVLNNLFSWTDKLPHRQINVFVRNGTLTILQRGKETGTVTIKQEHPY